MSKLKDKIDYLYEKQQITYQAKLYAYGLITPDLDWPKWMLRFSLLIGVTLFLAGVIFFFAYNWAALSDFQKFATIEIAMIIGLLGYLFSPKKQILISKLFLLALSVLVGVFLAVFGQIYQTGADTYELFLMWAFLITGFVIFSQFQALWFLWVLLINVGLYFFINLKFGFQAHELNLLSLLSLFNILVLYIREMANTENRDWLKPNWSRYAGLIMILGLQIPGAFIFFMGDNIKVYPSGIIYVLSCLGLGCLYQVKIKDIQAVSIILFSVFIISEALLFNLLGGARHRSDEGLFLLMGLGTIGLIILMVKILKISKQKMGGRV
jgi:uncharacterized membrane protein